MKQEQPTICWTCKRSLADPVIGCSWSRHLEPVEGWEAIPREVRYTKNNNKVFSTTYNVRKCPLYLGEEENNDD